MLQVWSGRSFGGERGEVAVELKKERAKGQCKQTHSLFITNVYETSLSVV